MIDKSFGKKRNKFFAELRKLGYTTKQNYGCCRSCNWAEFEENEHPKIVFYCVQQGANHVWLSWKGNGREICDVAHRLGLLHDWNGNKTRSILIVDNGVIKYDNKPRSKSITKIYEI